MRELSDSTDELELHAATEVQEHREGDQGALPAITAAKGISFAIGQVDTAARQKPSRRAVGVWEHCACDQYDRVIFDADHRLRFTPVVSQPCKVLYQDLEEVHALRHAALCSQRDIGLRDTERLRRF